MSAKLKLPSRIHITGICGVATSAIAIALKEAGVTISGSDKGFFPPVSTQLQEHGINFYAGWHPEKMIENGVPELIIAGASGTSPNNPELVYAKEHSIPVKSFAEALGEYVVRKNSVVVAGTWGKTSSSTLLSHIFRQAGIDPSYFIGGISLSHPSAAVTNSDWSIVEGDEYKAAIWDNSPKFAYYRPSHLLLTAVSWDHADLYPTEKSFFDVFNKLVSTMLSNGLIVGCAYQDGVMKVLGSYSGRQVLYSKNPGANIAYSYSDVKQSIHGLEFTISHHGKTTRVTSKLLGTFQAENITGCFAMAYECGIPEEKIVSAIASFKGMKRRLEKRLEGPVTVIDDIAHSPEKAASVLQSLRAIYSGTLSAVFEPNIGGRSRESAAKYDQAFDAADLVIIPRLSTLKVAADATDRPMDGAELATTIAKTHKNVRYIDNDAELVSILGTNKKAGDVIAFLGSHGFRGMIEEVVDVLKRQG